MDSIEKIVEEMRRYTKDWGEPPEFIVDGWADRIEALMKEYVAEIIAHDTAADVWWQKPTYDLPIGTKLFAVPPAPAVPDWNTVHKILCRVWSREDSADEALEILQALIAAAPEREE